MFPSSSGEGLAGPAPWTHHPARPGWYPDPSDARWRALLGRAVLDAGRTPAHADLGRRTGRPPPPQWQAYRRRRPRCPTRHRRGAQEPWHWGVGRGRRAAGRGRGHGNAVPAPSTADDPDRPAGPGGRPRRGRRRDRAADRGTRRGAPQTPTEPPSPSRPRSPSSSRSTRWCRGSSGTDVADARRELRQCRTRDRVPSSTVRRRDRPGHRPRSGVDEGSLARTGRRGGGRRRGGATGGARGGRGRAPSRTPPPRAGPGSAWRGRRSGSPPGSTGPAPPEPHRARRDPVHASSSSSRGWWCRWSRSPVRELHAGLRPVPDAGLRLRLRGRFGNGPSTPTSSRHRRRPLRPRRRRRRARAASNAARRRSGAGHGFRHRAGPARAAPRTGRRGRRATAAPRHAPAGRRSRRSSRRCRCRAACGGTRSSMPASAQRSSAMRPDSASWPRRRRRCTRVSTCSWRQARIALVTTVSATHSWKDAAMSATADARVARAAT